MLSEVLHMNALQGSSSDNKTPSRESECYTKIHCITLHYTTPHYTTLHYTTLHHTRAQLSATQKPHQSSCLVAPRPPGQDESRSAVARNVPAAPRQPSGPDFPSHRAPEEPRRKLAAPRRHIRPARSPPPPIKSVSRRLPCGTDVMRRERIVI